MSIFQNTTGNPTLGVGVCDRCRKKFPIGELTPDRDSPGLMVCRKDNDEVDRYKLPARTPESVTLRKIRLDVDISDSVGIFDEELFDPGIFDTEAWP